MPWRECTYMSEREELVALALKPGANLSQLCRSYGVSRKTAYKWLSRQAEQGRPGLADKSRRPLSSPRQTPEAMEKQVCELRQETGWGGRKLHHTLRNEGAPEVPASSTITGILRRNQLLQPERRLERDWQRFEAEAPNDLWQMDFKGHFATGKGRCHPLTILDDHSRFNLCLAACTNERTDTVRSQLSRVFDLYGLPQRMLMDNGAPWGSGYSWQPFTHLGVWLIRLGISVSHGRPYYPQTQGKEERFHRTLLAEVVRRRPRWDDFDQVQAAFDAWRPVYNLRRPHQALDYKTPVTRYNPSPLRLPSRLPEIDYGPEDLVRKVQGQGELSFRGREHHVGRAFAGEPVALRAVADGVWQVYYCHQRIAVIDLTPPTQV